MSIRFRPIGTFTKVGGYPVRRKMSEVRKPKSYHRYTFESKETFVAKVIRRLNFTHDDHVLDAYAIFPVVIVARLCPAVSSTGDRRWEILTIRNSHPRFQRRAIVCYG
jgi:hypothetical protein